MSKLTELRERSAKLAAEIRKMGDLHAKDGFTDEQSQNWDRLNADYDACAAEIKIHERSEQVATEQRNLDPARMALGRPMPGGGTEQRSEFAQQIEQRSNAMSGWLRGRRGLATEVETRALQECGLSVNDDFAFNLLDTMRFRSLQRAYRAGHPSGFEQRAQSALLGSGGGFMVAEGFIGQLEVAMIHNGPMLQTSTILRTSDGGELPWPTCDDSAEDGEDRGENQQATDSDLVFGRLVMRAYKFSSKIITVPTELLQDSAIGVQAIVGELIGERLARRANSKLTNGVGGGAEPLGILNAVGTATPDAGNADAADDIIDLVHSINLSYRSMGSFMCADSTVAALRKLRDADGQPLWSSGINAGQSDRLAGYPIAINSHFPAYGSTGTGQGVVVFGDLRKYVVRQVLGIRLERDRNIGTDAEQFVAYLRLDGNYLNAGGDPIKKMTIQIGAVS